MRDTITDGKRLHRLSTAEGIAHATTLAAISLTYLLSWGTVELNPVASWMFGALGYPATAAVAMLGVAGAFAVFRYVETEYARVARAGGWALAGIGLVDVAINLWRLSSLGLPETAKYSVAGEIIVAGAAAIALSMAVRHRDRLPSPNVGRSVRPTLKARRRSLALGFVVLVSLSGIAPFVAFSPVDTVQAAGGDVLWSANGDTSDADMVYDKDRDVFWAIDVESGIITGYDASSGDVVSEASTEDSLIQYTFAEYDTTSDLLITANQSGSLTGIKPSTGERVWGKEVYDSGYNPEAMAINGDGTALASLTSDTSVIIDTSTGENVSQLDYSDPYSRAAYDKNTGNYILLDQNGNVRSVNPETGTIEWEDTSPSNPEAVAISEKFVWVGSFGNLIKYHRSNGTRVNSFSLSADIYDLTAGPNSDIVHAGLDSGDAVQVQSDGTISWQKSVGSNILEVEQSIGDVVVGTYDVSTVSGVDAGYEVGKSVSGTITDADGNPIEGVTVNTGSASATTDASGNYELILPEGSHTLTASKSGYLEQSTDISVSGSSVTGVDFSLGIYGVTGTVESQTGDPVSGQTVQVHGMNYSHPDISSAPDPEQEARETLESYAEAVPESWDDGLQLETDVFDSANGHYAAVTTEEADEDTWFSTSDLGNPQIQVSPGEELYITEWDPSTTGGLLGQGEWDSQLPGSTVDDGEIVIEQVTAGGDSTSSTTVKTTETESAGGLGPISDPSTVDYAKVEGLSPGFYRVYPSANPASSYVIQVGSLQSAATESTSKLITPELKNETGQLSKAAQEEAQALANNKMVRRTAVTNEDGSFSVQLPENVETVSVQVVGEQPGEVLNETTGEMEVPDAPHLRQPVQSVQNWSEAATDSGSDSLDSLNSSSYVVSTAPKIVDVPSSNVRMQVVEISTPGFGDVGSDINKSALREKLLDNLTYSDLPQQLLQNISALQNKTALNNLSQVDSERIEELYNELSNLSQENTELENRVKKLLQERNATTSADALNESINLYLNSSTATNAEMVERVTSIETALSQLEDTLEAGEGETTVSDNTLSWVQPFDADLNPENVAVQAHYTNGTKRTLTTDSPYVSVNSRIGLQDEVRIEDLPLGEAAGAGITVDVATDEGTGSAEETVKNPAYAGKMPELDALALSSLRPGPRETVTATLRPASSSPALTLESVSVTGPDGSEIPATVNGTRTARFTTDGSGPYALMTTFSTPNGQKHKFTQFIEAGSESGEMDPTLRVRSTPYGPTAIVGDGFSGGDVTLADGGTSISVVATVPKDAEAPDEVDVHLSELSLPPDSTLEIRFAKGQQQQSIGKHIETTVHLGSMSAGTLVWRNGDPLTDDAKIGQIERGAGASTVQTHTDDSATLTIRKNADPRFWERIGHSIAQYTAGLSFGVLGGFGAGTAGVPAIAGLLVAGKRRRSS